MNAKLAALIIMFIISIINILLFNNILDRVLSNQTQKALGSYIFTISNMFIASFTLFNYVGLIICILLWGIMTTIRNPKFAFIPIIGAALIDLRTAIATTILVNTIFILIKLFKFKRTAHIKIMDFLKFNTILPLIVLIIADYFELLLVTNIQTQLINIGSPLYLFAFGIPLIYLVIGLFATFIEVKELKKITIILGMITLSMFSFYISLLTSLLFICLTAIGINHIIHRRWFVKELQKPSITLLLLLVLFYTISFTNVTLESLPSNELVTDIQTIEEYHINNNIVGKILTDKQETKYLEYFSKLNYYTTNTNSTQEILNNGNIEILHEFFSKNNISTVYIPNRMLNKKWSRSDQGILLLLTQSNRFTKINNLNTSLAYVYTYKELNSTTNN
jgi:hypothetical protein